MGQRWVTFDCFGTLVDWRHGIATGAELIAPGHGGELLELYTKHEAAVQAEAPTMRYRLVLAETLRRACAEAGVALLEDDASVLADGIAYWPVFGDTRRELGALRAAGWRIALLTNCDRDIIGETQRRLRVPIDVIVTAEDVGAYKPAHQHFVRFEEIIGGGRERWVHVAQSYFHDMVPASQLGITRVWINRLGAPDDSSIVDAVLPDLGGLPGVLDRLVSIDGA